MKFKNGPLQVENFTDINNVQKFRHINKDNFFQEKEAGSMKIENGYSKHVQQLRKAEQAQQDQTKKAEEKTEREPGVSVEISEEAKALLEADQSGHSERIQKIKEKIENGEYELNPEAISNGLLNTIQSQKEQ